MAFINSPLGRRHDRNQITGDARRPKAQYQQPMPPSEIHRRLDQLAAQKQEQESQAVAELAAKYQATLRQFKGRPLSADDVAQCRAKAQSVRLATLKEQSLLAKSGQGRG